MARLDGRTAIVTGGAKSLGLAFAGALAAEGANIVIADIEDAAQAAREIADAHCVEAIARITDVADEAAVEAFVEMTMARFGRIDILVNNAALFATVPLMPFTEVPVDLFDRIMAVNIRGSFLMARQVAPHMIAAGSGKIVNISSGTACKGMPDMLPYVASKAAVLGLTRSMARELGPHGINVNTLAPGLIESDSVLENRHHLAISEKVIGSRALPRAGLTGDLPGALLFLASGDSDFVTGQTLVVDGGSVML